MKKKMNNKGFSLVELIVVIAIMGVLVGLLAPQFIKYVEDSRKKTDVKNGQEIAAAIQAAMADGTVTADVDETNPVKVDTTNNTIGAILTGNNYIASIPKGKSSASGAFYTSYNKTNGKVIVYFSADGTGGDKKKVYPDNEY